MTELDAPVPDAPVPPAPIPSEPVPSEPGPDTSAADESVPRRRSTRKRPSDDDLLDAARAVVAELGPDRVTMDMIAARGDTTRVTLYAHFGSRDALLERLVDRETDLFAAWMLNSYEQSSGLQFGARARHAVDSLFDYVRSIPTGFGCCSGTDIKVITPAAGSIRCSNHGSRSCCGRTW